MNPSGPRILVIGSLNVDFTIHVDALPKAGATVQGREFRLGLGGKGANQAIAASRLGGRVAMAGRLGADVFADQYIRALAREQIDTSCVLQTDGQVTGSAFIPIEPNGQNRIIVIPGANARYSREDVDRAFAGEGQIDYVVLQLEIPRDVVVYTIEQATRRKIPCCLNPSPIEGATLETELMGQLDCLVVNEVEASALAGYQVGDRAEVKQAAELFANWGIAHVVITLGERGAYLSERGKGAWLRPFDVQPVDTVAAGDTFAGALIAELTKGASLVEAGRFANAAAALCVTRHGAMASIPHRQEVENWLNESPAK